MNKIDNLLKLTSLLKISNDIDLTKIDNFSYSAIMRKLNENCSDEQIEYFLSLYKTYFDLAIDNNLKNPEYAALQNSLLELSKKYKVKISNNLFKNAKNILSNKDENNATIVSNQRETDLQDYLDEANIKSFAPPTEYPERLNQDFSRDMLAEQQRDINKALKPHKHDKFPLSGLHESTEDMAGAGFIFATNNVMKKKSYILDMSYDISDVEKQKADQAILCFDEVIKNMYKASEYLDLIKQPFEKDANISSKEVLDIRSKLREYRDETVNKFNLFKTAALKCLNIMEGFSSDTQTLKLIKIFVSSIEEIEEEVNNFVNNFSSLEDPEFVKNVITYSTNIQDLCDTLEDIIYNRIVKHIKTNILATSWADSISSTDEI